MKRCLKQYVKEPHLIVLFRCRNKNENGFNGMVQFTWNTKEFSWSHRQYMDGKPHNVEAAAVFTGSGNKKTNQRCKEMFGGWRRNASFRFTQYQKFEKEVEWVWHFLVNIIGYPVYRDPVRSRVT